MGTGNGVIEWGRAHGVIEWRHWAQACCLLEPIGINWGITHLSLRCLPKGIMIPGGFDSLILYFSLLEHVDMHVEVS